MSSPQARPKLSGKHGFQTQGAGDEREARVGDDGNERSARAGSDGGENPCSPFVPAFPIRKRHSKVNLCYFEFHCYYSTALNFSSVGFSWNCILKGLTDPGVEIKKKIVVFVLGL